MAWIGLAVTSHAVKRGGGAREWAATKGVQARMKCATMNDRNYAGK